MGLKFSKNQKIQRILILGLKDAGKTHLLYRFVFDQDRKLTRMHTYINTSSSLRYNREHIQLPGKPFPLDIYDLSGDLVLRPLWNMIFEGVHFEYIIFVIDASKETERNDQQRNLNRFEEEYNELARVVNNKDLKNSYILIHLNWKEAQLESQEDVDYDKNANPPLSTVDLQILDKLGVKTRLIAEYDDDEEDTRKKKPKTTYRTEYYLEMNLFANHFRQVSVVKTYDSILNEI